jgi:alpha-tubulin suppressor-like RCC1 family protein
MLAAGETHNCALMQSGAVRCWGANHAGALGVGHTNHIGDEPNEMPPAATNVGNGVVIKLEAGQSMTCALFDNGTVRCWGNNASGQLGQEHTNTIGDEPNEMPPPVIDLGGIPTDLVVGRYSAWAVLESGALRSWGRGLDGMLGYNNTVNIGDQPNEMPPADVDIDGLADRLAHGQAMNHMCVVLTDNTVRCWGSGDNGALGYGHTSTLGNQPGEMPTPAVEVF